MSNKELSFNIDDSVIFLPKDEVDEETLKQINSMIVTLNDFLAK